MTEKFSLKTIEKEITIKFEIRLVLAPSPIFFILLRSGNGYCLQINLEEFYNSLSRLAKEPGPAHF